MKLTFFSIILILFSKLCFAENTSSQTPFDTSLQTLSLSVSDVVTTIDPALGNTLEADVIDLSNVINSNSCQTQIGEINESSGVDIPAYSIPGATYNLQMAALLRDAPELSAFADEIYPFFNLMAAYANENNLQNLESISSVELAQKLSEFASKKYKLHMPKGVLLVEVINQRIIRDPTKLALAFGGVSALSLNEKTEILHQVINRMDEDPITSSAVPLDRTKRMASYFSQVGLSQGLIINENHRGVNRYTIIVKDTTSGKFVRNSYTPTHRTLGDRQEFLQLNGTSLKPELVPEDYRDVVSSQLLSQKDPEVWSIPTNDRRPSPITIQTPQVVTSPREQTGLVPLQIQGLNQEIIPDEARVDGDAGITFRTGSLPTAQTFTPVNVNVIDTDINDVEIPNYLNPNQNNRRQQSNILGLTQSNSPNGEILETSLSTVTANEGLVLRAVGSRSNGSSSHGFSSLVETGRNGQTIEGSGFYQDGQDFGVSGRYRNTLDGRLIEGRSFFTIDTSDNSDPENPSRGISVTAITNYRSLETELDTTTSLNTTIATNIPVGQNDLVRTIVTVDADQGITNAAGLYSTQVSDTTRLSVSAQTNEAGQNVSGRVANTNTVVAVTNEVTTLGQTQNTVTLGQNLDSVLPNDVQGFVRVERSDGDIEQRTTIGSSFNIEPGVILSDRGQIVISTNDSTRNAPNGELIQDQSSRSYTVMDTISTETNFDLRYVTSRTGTPNTEVDRNEYGMRLTYGVDRQGNPTATNDGIVGSVNATYVTEDTDSDDPISNGQTRQQYSAGANIGYTDNNQNNGSSFNITAGPDYTYEVVRNSGTLVSEREDQGFRISSEYSRGLQRRQASCSANNRTTASATGISRERPWECRVTFSQRF